MQAHLVLGPAARPRPSAAVRGRPAQVASPKARNVRARSAQASTPAGDAGIWQVVAAAHTVTVTHGQSAPPATTPAWCTEHGSSFVEWSGTFPDLPLCGPGPDYGGSWAYVDQPGPSGDVGARFYNATPGFQCVELADRYLAVADGLAPVLAEGSQVAANYHAAYPTKTRLVLNGSPGAVGHPPVAGDVISFSEVSDFQDPTDGHVAVVVSSRVDRRTGDGVVDIAQQNVAEDAMRRSLLLEHWQLVDPEEPPNAEWQFPFAEWLHVLTPHPTVIPARVLEAARRQTAELAGELSGWRAAASRRPDEQATPKS
jgi:hypothetical protein